jgi:hypothetical protein
MHPLTGKQIACEMVFVDGSKGTKGQTANYTVTIDSPPQLWFSDDRAADFIAVNTTNHAAVMITRVADQQFIGSKVCHGMFATQSELEALRK